MNPAAVTVTLRHCARHFNHQLALQPLDLTVQRRNPVLLGPSGCGKTTTLRIISGRSAVTTAAKCGLTIVT